MAVETEVKTTGQLRTMLAGAAKAVMQGTLDIDRANALHKLAKNISDSMYSETKIATLHHELGQEPAKFGALQLGESTSK